MRLPLFPLHAVLFPGRPLALHIFEPRYRAMLADVLDGDRRFGVVAIRSGHEVGGPAEIHDVGTVAHLEDVQLHPDGRADVVTRGEGRFHVVEAVPGKPYLLADVELLDDEPPGGDAGTLAEAVRSALKPYLCALGAPPELMELLPDDPVQLGYFAAASLQTDLPEQQRLLALGSVQGRLAATLRLLRREQGIARHFGTMGSLKPPAPGPTDLN